MGYGGFRNQDALLQKALQTDRSPVEGKKNSVRDIVLALSNFLGSQGKTPYKFDTFASKEKSLYRFQNGDNIKDNYLKRDLWDYYVDKGLIRDVGIEGDVNSFIIVSDMFFMQDNKAHNNMSGMAGLYFAYKKAIRDPENLLIKYFVKFKEVELSKGILLVEEFHYNRTFKADYEPVIVERWSGMLMMRRQANYFGLIRELTLGTPHAYTLHSIQYDHETNEIKQIFGESIEIVENWGKISTLESRIVLERIPKGDANINSSDECDLIFVDTLRKTRPDIVSYIFGGRNEA